jgi:hypothetical protein
MDVSLTQRHDGTKTEPISSVFFVPLSLCVKRSGNVIGLHTKSVTTSLSEKLRSVGF